MKDIQKLAALIGKADSALVAATAARGLDGHGEPLPHLIENLAAGCECIEAAAAIVGRMRGTPPPIEARGRRGFLTHRGGVRCRATAISSTP